MQPLITAFVLDHESEIQNAMLRNFIYIAVLLLGNSLTVSAQTQHKEHPLHIEEDGNRAFLGIMSEKISKEKAEKLGFDNPYGSYVSSVIKNAAADKAGVRPFDYIYGIENTQTSRTVSLGDLLGQYEPGDKISLQIIRNGNKRDMKVTLGTREDANYASEEKEKSFFGVSPAYSDRNAMAGAEINVVSGSSAEKIGLENGDVITSFNNHKILDWTDLTIAIGMVDVGKSISVDYMRDNDNGKAAGVMGSKEDHKKSYQENIVSSPPKEDKAFLGVVSDRISSSKVRKMGLENPYGYYVTEVVNGSAAQAGGIKVMDYIYGIDEYRVGEQVGLSAMLNKFNPGDEATVHLMRKGNPEMVKIRFTTKAAGKKPKKEKKSRNACEKPFLGIMQGYDEDPNELTGVQVNIVENSTAQAAGMEDGDIIGAINGYCMVDWGDITLALSQVKPGDPIALTYSHSGTFKTVNTTIKSYSETKECEDCDCGKKAYGGIDIHIDKEELEDDLERLGDDLEELGEDLGDMIRVRRRGGYDVETVDVSSYEISIGDADTAELNQLNQNHGTDISTRQDLTINSMRLAAYPEDRQFRLAFDLANQGDTKVEIYNSEGRRIYQYEASAFSGTFEDAVNVGQNGSGNYYLYIQQGDLTAVRKIQLTQR